MDIETMSIVKFRKYQSDWNYHQYVRSSYILDSPKGQCVTFQASMKLTLVTGQCFGLMPVIGICEPDANKLRFMVKSFRFVYALMTIFNLLALIVLCLLNTFKDTDKSIGSNTSLVFHILTWITGVLFLRIAMKWPGLCMRIARTEAADPNMDYGLIRRCNLSCFLVLTFAMLEHAFAVLNSFSIAKDCDPETDLYESYSKHSFGWIFNIFPYNPFSGFVAQFFNLQCTFNWNFGDVFVICMSLYLTSRLDQINLRIQAVKGRYVPSSFWRTMREDYSRACGLVRTVDDIIGGIIFVSFASNLFFICLQLLHILAEGGRGVPRCKQDSEVDQRPLKGYEQPVYFAYSFIFLMARSVSVSLIASRVHSASKAPAIVLYDVTSSTYCIEIQRFLEQIHGDTVALSGLQFFNVKRGLVLAIAGTIVTYELVLMQFTGVSPTSTTPL